VGRCGPCRDGLCCVGPVLVGDPASAATGAPGAQFWVPPHGDSGCGGERPQFVNNCRRHWGGGLSAGLGAGACAKSGDGVGCGLVINWVIGHRLHAHQHGNLNLRSAYLHVVGDALASLGVIVGAVVINLTGWLWVDPLLSVLIAGLIAVGAYQVLDDEYAPPHLGRRAKTDG
jgi:hypothetical protein